MTKPEKLLFKIWDRKDEVYVSANRKTHWRSMKWVASKLIDLHKSGCEMNNFEIRTFELRLIDIRQGSSIFEDGEKEPKIEMTNKEISEQMKAKILNIFPGVSIYRIRKMYHSRDFSQKRMRELKPLMQKLVQAEKNFE